MPHGAASPRSSSACPRCGPSRGGGDDLARWMASAPAALAALPAKGRLAVGCDADLVAFDPDETYVVDAALLEHRHPVTPYAGRSLTGRVRQTWLRGIPLLEGKGEAAVGRLLKRG